MMEFVVRRGESHVSARVDGSGNKAPILFVTGFIGVRAFWDPFMRTLPSDRPIISFDQRGTGTSGPFETPLTMEQLADDAIAVIDEADQGPVDLIGHSMGACIGWIIADKASDRLRSAALVAGWHRADAWMRRVFDARLSAYECAGGRAFVDLTTLFMIPPGDVSVKDAEIALQEETAASVLPPIEQVRSRTEAVMTFDADAWVPSASVPLGIFCARDDVMTPSYLSEALAVRATHAQYRELADGGHYVPRTRPTELGTALARWRTEHVDDIC